MTSSANAQSDAAALPRPGQRGTVAVSLAAKVATTLRRAVRAGARLAVLAWRKHGGDWQTAARERYLRRAVDLSDLEQRQRAWDRDESNSYSMAGWS